MLFAVLFWGIFFTKNGMIFVFGHLGRRTMETPTSISGGAIKFSISQTCRKVQISWNGKLLTKFILRNTLNYWKDRRRKGNFFEGINGFDFNMNYFKW